MATAACVQLKDKIELTQNEKKIFEGLLNTLRHFNLQIQLRVAGGWARDKLLGKERYDIDIAPDNLLSNEFVDKVQEYLSSTDEGANKDEDVAEDETVANNESHNETVIVEHCEHHSHQLPSPVLYFTLSPYTVKLHPSKLQCFRYSHP